MITVAAAVLVALVVVCLVLGRYNHHSTLGSWEWILSQECHRAVDELDRALELDRRMARSAVDAARGAPDIVEARRLMALATAVLQRALGERLSKLRGMALCVRMASAVMPMPPVRPAGFCLAELRGLAGVAALAHHLLVGLPERFRLRLRVIAWGFRLAMHAFGSAGRSIDWRRAEAAMEDWAALDGEQAASFETMLRSLDAVLRVTAPAAE